MQTDQQPTTVYRGYHGWTAETSLHWRDQLWLNFITMRRSSGQLTTTVRAERLSDGVVSFVVFQDFYQQVIAERPARVTERAVADQHRRALAQLDLIRQQCEDHYQQLELN